MDPGTVGAWNAVEVGNSSASFSLGLRPLWSDELCTYQEEASELEAPASGEHLELQTELRGQMRWRPLVATQLKPRNVQLSTSENQLGF